MALFKGVYDFGWIFQRGFSLILQDVAEELNNYQSVIDALHEQAGNLGEQVRIPSNGLFSLHTIDLCKYTHVQIFNEHNKFS